MSGCEECARLVERVGALEESLRRLTLAWYRAQADLAGGGEGRLALETVASREWNLEGVRQAKAALRSVVMDTPDEVSEAFAGRER